MRRRRHERTVRARSAPRGALPALPGTRRRRARIPCHARRASRRRSPGYRPPPGPPSAPRGRPSRRAPGGRCRARFPPGAACATDSRPASPSRATCDREPGAAQVQRQQVDRLLARPRSAGSSGTSSLDAARLAGRRPRRNVTVLSLVRAKRQGEPERAPPSDLALDPDPTAVQLDDLAATASGRGRCPPRPSRRGRRCWKASKIFSRSPGAIPIPGVANRDLDVAPRPLAPSPRRDRRRAVNLTAFVMRLRITCLSSELVGDDHVDSRLDLEGELDASAVRPGPAPSPAASSASTSENGAGSSSIRPASIFERSRISLSSSRRWRPESRMSFRYSRLLVVERRRTCRSSSTSEKPITALSGVRSSCDMLARNSDLCALATSSCRFFSPISRNRCAFWIASADWLANLWSSSRRLDGELPRAASAARRVPRGSEPRAAGARRASPQPSRSS